MQFQKKNLSEEFNNQIKENIDRMSEDEDFKGLSNVWNRLAIEYKYSYNFTWLGRPIIQVPQDIYAIQELIWKVKPDLIIETGVAHGGSLIMSASMLALLDYCEASKPKKRSVLGIDNDIRPHNKKTIKDHPLFPFITLIEGSSIDQQVYEQVNMIAQLHNNILVFLDSNHTHNHVLEELRLYAPLTSVNSYCMIWDTGIEDLPDYINNKNNRPWGKNNNPKTAINHFLSIKENSESFIIDKELPNKLMITSSPYGFLKRIK